MPNSLLSDRLVDFDLLTQSPFTKTDYAILNSYQAVVDSLVMLVGNYCEIVFFSLENAKPSVVKRVVNFEQTQSEPDFFSADLALDSMLNGADQKPKIHFTRSKSGALMKSMMLVIPNHLGRHIGLLCISINLDTPFSKMVQIFTPSIKQETTLSSNAVCSIEELITQTLERSIATVNGNCKLANHAKNRQIVFDLYERGIFDVKDAINMVADRLSISRHTVYLYIRQFKNGDLDGDET